jgi:hypothetical protein
MKSANTLITQSYENSRMFKLLGPDRNRIGFEEFMKEKKPFQEWWTTLTKDWYERIVRTDFFDRMRVQLHAKGDYEKNSHDFLDIQGMTYSELLPLESTDEVTLYEFVCRFIYPVVEGMTPNFGPLPLTRQSPHIQIPPLPQFTSQIVDGAYSFSMKMKEYCQLVGLDYLYEEFHPITHTDQGEYQHSLLQDHLRSRAKALEDAIKAIRTYCHANPTMANDELKEVMMYNGQLHKTLKEMKDNIKAWYSDVVKKDWFIELKQFHELKQTREEGVKRLRMEAKLLKDDAQVLQAEREIKVITMRRVYQCIGVQLTTYFNKTVDEQQKEDDKHREFGHLIPTSTAGLGMDGLVEPSPEQKQQTDSDDKARLVQVQSRQLDRELRTMALSGLLKLKEQVKSWVARLANLENERLKKNGLSVKHEEEFKRLRDKVLDYMIGLSGHGVIPEVDDGLEIRDLMKLHDSFLRGAQSGDKFEEKMKGYQADLLKLQQKSTLSDVEKFLTGVHNGYSWFIEFYTEKGRKWFSQEQTLKKNHLAAVEGRVNQKTTVLTQIEQRIGDLLFKLHNGVWESPEAFTGIKGLHDSIIQTFTRNRPVTLDPQDKEFVFDPNDLVIAGGKVKDEIRVQREQSISLLKRLQTDLNTLTDLESRLNVQELDFRRRIMEATTKLTAIDWNAATTTVDAILDEQMDSVPFNDSRFQGKGDWRGKIATALFTEHHPSTKYHKFLESKYVHLEQELVKQEAKFNEQKARVEPKEGLQAMIDALRKYFSDIDRLKTRTQAEMTALVRQTTDFNNSIELKSAMKQGLDLLVKAKVGWYTTEYELRVGMERVRARLDMTKSFITQYFPSEADYVRMNGMMQTFLLNQMSLFGQKFRQHQKLFDSFKTYIGQTVLQTNDLFKLPWNIFESSGRMTTGMNTDFEAVITDFERDFKLFVGGDDTKQVKECQPLPSTATPTLLFFGCDGKRFDWCVDIVNVTSHPSGVLTLDTNNWYWGVKDGDHFNVEGCLVDKIDDGQYIVNGLFVVKL